MTQIHTPAPSFDFVAHLARQAAWSEKTFGPGPRVEMVLDHIRKELTEIEAEPGDLEEWVDLIILALDGAWRAGANPQQIIAGIVAKQTKNEGRSWPDWRMADPNKAIEHVRLLGATPAHAILDEHTTPAILGEAKAPTIRDAMRWSGCDPDYHGRIAFSPDQLEKFVSFFHCPSPTTRGEAKAVAPEGWKLVPIQPTAEMIAAGLEHTKLTTDEDDDPKLYRAKGQAAAVYHFMLDAVPIAPALPVTAEKSRDAILLDIIRDALQPFFQEDGTFRVPNYGPRPKLLQDFIGYSNGQPSTIDAAIAALQSPAGGGV